MSVKAEAVHNNANLTATDLEDKETGIRSAMSVSNLLTPPAYPSDIPEPSTPITTSATGFGSVVDNHTDADKVGVLLPSTPPSCEDDGESDNDGDVDMGLPSSSPAVTDVKPSTPVARDFHCCNDDFNECQTGQYTMELSRKVISDLFGRNKGCTRLITDWPLMCRKHYQRATYNQKTWQRRKVALTCNQLHKIESQFPGTLYTISLKKSEQDRLNLFSRNHCNGMSCEEATALVEPREGKHYEAPINILREISPELGPDKTVEQVEQMMTNIDEMLVQDEVKQIPAVEFLLQLDRTGQPWTTATGGSPSKANTKRVSKKGGIQKPVTPKKAKTKN